MIYVRYIQVDIFIVDKDQGFIYILLLYSVEKFLKIWSNFGFINQLFNDERIFFISSFFKRYVKNYVDFLCSINYRFFILNYMINILKEDV